MSLLIDRVGLPMTYAVVDIQAREILAGFKWIGQATKDLETRIAATGKPEDANLALHNITHPEVPGWLKDMVMGDPLYCAARAREFAVSAENSRREAETALNESLRLLAIAGRYRAAAGQGDYPDELLTADFTRALPGGAMDDTSFSAVEDALDQAGADMQGADGNWLTLPGRIAALGNALAEADALISTHQFTIDKNPPSAWPQDSALRRAVERHSNRQ